MDLWVLFDVFKIEENRWDSDVFVLICAIDLFGLYTPQFRKLPLVWLQMKVSERKNDGCSFM